MIETWKYKDVVYRSEYMVRQALGADKGVALPQTPEEGKVEFWAQWNVEYTQEAEPEITLDEVKAQKLAEISEKAESWRSKEGYVVSSLGFNADSTDTSKSDVDGMLTIYAMQPDAEILFRDAQNQFHQIKYEDLKTLQLEIIQNGLYLYEQKWSMQSAVQSAETKEAVEAVITIFRPKVFEVPAEEPPEEPTEGEGNA